MKVLLMSVSALSLVCAAKGEVTTVYGWSNNADASTTFATDANWVGGAAPNILDASGASLGVNFEASGAYSKSLRQSIVLPEEAADFHLGSLAGDQTRQLDFTTTGTGAKYRTSGWSVYLQNPNAFLGVLGRSVSSFNAEGPKRPGVVFQPGSGEIAILQNASTFGRVHYCVEDGGVARIVNPIGAGAFDVNIKPAATPTYFSGTLEIVNSPGPGSCVVLGGGVLKIQGVPTGMADAPASDPLVNLDASNRSSIYFTTEIDVARWRDTRAASWNSSETVAYSCNAGKWRKARYVAEASPTGLGAVDFGAFQGQNYATTPSATQVAVHGEPTGFMFGSDSNTARDLTGVKELFVAWRENDTQNCNPSVVGDENWGRNPAFRRSGMWGDGPLFVGGAQSFPAQRGEVRWDGQRIDGEWSPNDRGYGFHVFSASTVDSYDGAAVRYLGLSMDGGTDRGGATIGELLLYNRHLTTDERQQVNAYLYKKWIGKFGDGGWDFGCVQAKNDVEINVPAGRTARIRALSFADAGVTVHKTGDGVLEIGRLYPADGNLVVTAGRATVAAAPAPAAQMAEGPRFWLDATQIPAGDILVSEDAEPKKYVTIWRDARGVNPQGETICAARLPLNPCWFGSQFTDYKKYKAYATLVDGAANGRPVVDFGTFDPTDYMWTEKDVAACWERTGLDTAAYRFQNSATEGAGSVVDLSARELFAVIRLKNQAASIFAQCEGYETMVPGANLSTFFDVKSTRPNLVGGDWAVDGKRVDPLACTLSTENLMVVNVSSVAGISPTALGTDRGYHWWGGIQVAEYLAYSRKLTEAERRSTTAYLMEKWLGQQHPDAAETQQPFVATTALAANFTDRTTLEKTSVDGKFVILESGRVTVRWPDGLRAPKGGDYVLVETTDGLEGTANLANWELVCETAGEHQPMKLVADGKKLLLHVDSPGLCIIFR